MDEQHFRRIVDVHIAGKQRFDGFKKLRQMLQNFKFFN